MITNLKYEDDLQINMLSLHTEWAHQPVVFMRYSRELADCRDRCARAEQAVDVERAEADKRSRQRHADDEKKPTEGVITAEVVTDAEYRKANDNYLGLKHEVDILTAAVRAFDQRKDALENLVRLQAQNYFAGPSVPYDIGREFVKHTQEVAHEEARDRTATRTGRNQ